MRHFLFLFLLFTFTLSAQSGNAQLGLSKTAMVTQASGTLSEQPLVGGSALVDKAQSLVSSTLGTGTPPQPTATAPVAATPAQPQKVVLTYFFDYNCPACRAREADLEKLLATEKDVVIDYKELAWFGDSSYRGAIWSMAAEKQGKQDAFHRTLMQFQGTLDDNILMALAVQTGLDANALRTEAASPVYSQMLQQNEALRKQLKVDGVPAYFIGDKKIEGGVDAIQKAIVLERARLVTTTQGPAPAQVITPQPQSVTDAVTPNTAAQKKNSLFFTTNQLIAITRANQGFIAPQESYDPDNQSERPNDPGPRMISLAGIVYNSANDWTIWLNNSRVTPKNIPDRVMGISVNKNRIGLRWMDFANQRVVNLSLRPNQTYLLDSDTIINGTAR